MPGKSRGAEGKVKIVSFPPPRSSPPPQFEGIRPSSPHPWSCNSFRRGLQGNVTQRPEFWGAKFAWRGSPRGAGHWLGLGQFFGGHVLLELFPGSARSPGVRPGDPHHRRGLRLFGHATGLWGWEGGSLGAVSLRTFGWRFSALVFKRLGIREKKAGSCHSKGRGRTAAGASGRPKSASLPLGIDGRAANFGGESGTQVDPLAFWGIAARRYGGEGDTRTKRPS